MLGATGVKVHITELDVDMLPPATRNATADVSVRAGAVAEPRPVQGRAPRLRAAGAREALRGIFRVYLAHKDVIDRITFWGVADDDSWLNRWPVPGRTNYPLLFDRQNKPKLAYQRMMAIARDQGRPLTP